MSATSPLERPSLLAKYTQIFLVVSAHWFLSISMVFMNKQLLSGQLIELPAPLFITLYQCFCSVIVCLICGVLAQKSSKVKSVIDMKMSFDWHTAFSVLPLSIIFVSTITLNNLCLKNVEVAFYFIGRSLSTVFNVILTFIILREKTSFSALMCCAAIVFGYFLGCNQEGSSLSLSGVLYGTGASLCSALYAIHLKKTLPLVEENVWLLTLYNNVIAVVLLALLSLVTGEGPTLYHYQHLNSFYFWLLMTLSGLFGFAIGLISALLVHVTSPLTHSISGTAKGGVQTVIAVLWNSQCKSFSWWISNCLVVLGSALYARVRQLEMKRAYDCPLDPQCDVTKPLLQIKVET